MITKSEIETYLNGIGTDRLIELWWDLRIPGLGGTTPTEVFASDPARLLEYTKRYQELDN